MNEKILVVDDERSIADAIAYGMYREGYKVDTAYDGEEALEKIKSFSPKVIIMDIVMPKLNGYEVLKKIDSRNKMGIVILTAKNDIIDKVLGLELGADDYVTKPFDMRELLVRVKSLIRRLPEQEMENFENEIVIKELKVMVLQRKVLVKDELIDLTPKEFDLLVLLLSNIDVIFTREELLDKIWDMDYAGGTRTVDIHIQRLRKKLNKPYEDIIQTVYGIGYKAIGYIYEN
jgi:DNA-binding response OmpR family regulator